jgi:hypothetical protein
MNVTLRDFLNLNEQGMAETYQYNQIADKYSEWEKNIGKSFHLDPEYTGEHPVDKSKIEKYVNPADGREVVFGSLDKETWNLITKDLYKGTYNYGKPFDFLPLTNHYEYDMEPYFRQFPQTEPWYAKLWSNITR